MKISDSSIIIVTHVRSTGSIKPTDDLLKYLFDNRAKKVLLITHPLVYAPNITGSGYEFFLYGLRIRSFSFKVRRLPEALKYIKDIILTIGFALKSFQRYDLFIGYDNLNALAGLILKKLGIVKKCVFYVIDYSPIRFENRLLNWIYHRVETFCAIHCDETWNLSSRMIQARSHFQGISPSRGNQKVVPMGIWFNDMYRCDLSEINNHRLVFMGAILKKQGIQCVLRAIPHIVKYILDFEFVVIGDGEYLPTLKSLSKELSVDRYVRFLGYIESSKTVNDLIARSALAVALYERGDPKRNYTYYADPGKLKEYLGSGVPVLLTDVPHNAMEIENLGCGKITSLDPVVIAKTIVDLIGSEEILKKYRNNALIYSKQYDWVSIFNANLPRILS